VRLASNVRLKGNKLVNWPAIVKHSDDAELIYVGDETEWNNDAELCGSEYDVTDYLIDVSGNIFTLTNIENRRVIPEPNGNSIALHELLGLIKAHAAQKGSCCVAKLYAPTIGEAFRIVASLNEV
jgi:hypothetical protein